MRILKTFICILCAAAIGIFAHAASANDLSGNKYEDDILLLKDLGIMTGYEDGSFAPDSNITREEFVTLVIRLLRYEGCGSAVTLTFKDADTWAKAYIKDAVALGLIEGYSAEAFRPEDNITVNQAIKIIVTALGYGERAAGSGGYPYGYNIIAAKNGITKNVPVGEKAATRGNVASIIANSLDVVTSEVTLGTDGSVTYTEGDRTLAEMLGLIKTEGILLAAGSVNAANENISDGEIIIGGRRLKTDLNGLDIYVGNKVCAYVTEDEPYTAYHVTLAKGENSPLSVWAENIESASEILVSYTDENRRIQNAKISQNALFLKNGTLLPTAQITPQALKPESGFLSFIDTDGDALYDIVKITDTDTYIVSSVSGEMIYDIASGRIDTSAYGENGRHLSIIKDDGAISLSDIKKDDILSVAVSDDKKYMTIYVSDEYIDVSITATEASGGESYVTTDSGEEYRLSAWFVKKCAGSTIFKLLEPGVQARLGLDISGSIAASFEKSSSKELKYGALVALSADSPVNGNGEIKLMTAENEFEIYKIDQKIRFGRQTAAGYVKTKAAAREISEFLDAQVSSRVQLIKYAAEGENLSELYLAAETDNNAELCAFGTQFSGYYREGIIDGKYIIDQNTLLFALPGDGSETYKLFAGRAMDILKNGSNNNVKIYNVKNGIVGAVVKVDTILDGSLMTAIDRANSDVMLIESARSIKGSGDEYYLALTGYVNGYKKTVLCSDTLSGDPKTSSDLVCGAFVQYETNRLMLDFAQTSDDDEVVEVYKVIHNLNNTGKSFYQTWNDTDIRHDNAELCITYGRVINKDKKSITLSLSQGENADCAVEVRTRTSVYEYRAGEKKIYERSFDDVSVGMNVLIRQRYGSVREIIIEEE